MNQLFNADQLRGFKKDQLKAMLRILKIPTASVRKLSIAEVRTRIASYAETGAEANEALWHAYHSIRGDVSDGSGDEVADINELTEKVLSRIKVNINNQANDLLKAGLADQLDSIRKELSVYRPIEIVKTGSAKRKIKGRQHAAFERVLQLASQRVNVLLVGPAGSGKTYLGEQIAKALGFNFSSISCSAGMSESQLAGWLLPTGAGGKFEYAPSPYVNIYKKGGVFLFDEIDAGDPNTLTFVNKGIANDGFFVPQNLKEPYVKKHEDFVCIAAANTFGTGADTQYVGRNPLDAATLDRFKVGTVVMDYDKELEAELIHPKVLEWGWKIRGLINSNRLRRIMSTRVMLNLTKMTEAYKWGLTEWESAYFSDWSSDERRRVGSEGGSR